MKKEKSVIKMTEGPILPCLIRFTIPLLLGNLFQQLYNVADSVIVGNCLGESALAAVASSGSLVFMIVGFFSGIAVGAGVVVSKYFGAGDEEKVSMAVHTAALFAVVSGILLTAAAVPMTRQILLWMGTPEQVLPESVKYLRVYFLGCLPSITYNICVGILQAVGDSVHPLKYVILSSVLNIVLDLLFNGVFHLGVEYAGLATVLSQLTSAVLAVSRLIRSREVIRLYPSRIRFHKNIFLEIIQTGIPSGVQNSIISFANVVVQSKINSFGQNAMAGCGAYSKVEGFSSIPVSCFAMALTTFVSQNLGARQYARAKQGARLGCVCSALLAESLGLAAYLLAPQLISLFNQNPEVIAFGVKQAHTVNLFSFLMAFSHAAAGTLRGAGKASVSMLVMVIIWCGIRVAYIEGITMFFHTIDVVFYAYPITWLLSAVIFLLYLTTRDWVHGFESRLE